MIMNIEFREPERLHANSDTNTTAEIAAFLEAEYSLLYNFSEYIQAKLSGRVTKIMERFIQKGEYRIKSLEKMLNQQVGGWLQNEWRNYINDAEHGIMTGAALSAERQPFVDTGDYFKSMVVYIRIK